ncbi:uncharacterized protein PHACADRAFT_209070 [Phanerochaete carnosa HHB-10118-sp]|uniref:Uncharacterized protein n=1 Tax=Phanerochaete carnosa (strain HHB-10118-sp) TaxID=650164 RepID=K5VVI5_PHACS|nr:uncharacterized protein PHACADRAFT_209070 [Phanerochaete carnosa HHB-10118-sp]EKM55553.1 hypothetical protein PHACADRAFT_209070 [Phanerochaete carnosa HHB-10118-sp]
MLSSQDRHVSAPRKHYESDPDRPRHTTASTQRYTSEYGVGTAMPDKPHRNSRRADTSGNPLAFESVPSANKYSSPREQPYMRGPSYYTSSEPQAQVPTGPMTVTGVASSSRSRAHDPDIYAYAKRKTDKQSPRSSEEKIYGADQIKPSRATQQLRSGHHTANPVPQSGTAYAASSQYQSARDATSSSMHHKDRNKDQGEHRERRRDRRRDQERIHEEEERLRERAAIEKELEKQRRREERRTERDREKERERRREERELERARRHGSRARDESRTVNTVYPNAALVASKHQGSTDQVPSSSSNVALPSTQYAIAAGNRPHVTNDPRRDNISSMQTAPPHVPEKERKARRSQRDKVLAQQYAQDSGVSSSEQEQARERLTRDRRHALRDANGDAHYSGPSGSENERGPGYERRKYKAAQDPYAALRQHSVGPQVNANMPSSIQHGSYGPADAETPVVRSKTPFTPGQDRARDVGPMPVQMQSSTQSGQQLSYHDLGSQQQSRTLSHRPSQSDMPRGYGTGPMSNPAYAPHAAQSQSTATPFSVGTQGGPGNQPTVHRETALGVEGIHPSTTYPSSVTAPIVTATPPSMTVPTRPSPAHNQQSLPTKISHGTPPTKNIDAQIRHDGTNAPGHHAKLNIYHSPHYAASAEIFVPGMHQPQTQSVTVNTTTVKDLAAKFPLNEDILTSASSSTLNAGTNRSEQGPAALAQYPPGANLTTQGYPNRELVPQVWLPPDNHNTTASQKQPAPFENDVPIPIPYPKSMIPGSAPSQPMASSAAYQQQPSARPQATPLQSKTSPMPPQAHIPTHTVPNPVNVAPKIAQPPVSTSASGNFSAASHSPGQSFQQPPQRSPSTLNGIPLMSSGTPKQSPSMRLKARNGSTETVVYPGAKASPSHSARHIPHRTSTGNLQAPSRPDTNPSRPQPASHEYPDTSRYRPQPAGYSTPNPTFNYQPPIANQSNDSYSQPTHSHHTRSASQPVLPNPTYDSHGHAPRSHTLPAAVPPSPAAAPSASAIAAAYRSGMYGTDSAVRSQPLPDKRVPSRAAPSPAPTYPAQQQQPPSALPKTAYALQATRGAALSTTPSAARVNGPAATGHSRSVSDPQQMVMAGRVAISGHPSTPAPAKAQLTSPSEQELLMTPSSLAPSMLKGGSNQGGNQTPFPTSRPAPQQFAKPPSTKESTRKRGGLFGIFRSRSSPPKQDARVADALADPPVAKPRQRSTSQGTINAVAASVRNIIAPHPHPSRSAAPQPAPNPPPTSTPRTSGERSRTRAPAGNDSESVRSMRRREPSSPPPPPQVLASRPVRTVSEQPVQIGPNAKVFTPFRLITKRHRTVSAASNEADHGTQATSTIIGGESARSSTAGRLSPPIPLRDPKAATEVWINQEEAELMDRGTWRRRRPGVVFDPQSEQATSVIMALSARIDDFFTTSGFLVFAYAVSVALRGWLLDCDIPL